MLINHMNTFSYFFDELMLIGFIFIYLQDNVFVNVVASIQYRALANSANDAFYKLSNTRSQIQAYVFDGIMHNLA